MNPYTQGIYQLKYPNAYKGTLPVVYRSRPEFKTFIFLERMVERGKIRSWSSESVIIPYIKPTDGKVHRYFIDFYCEFINTDGSITKYIIEYKPEKFTKPPPMDKKMTKSRQSILMQYLINESKWKAAKQYADKHDMKFMILTEKDIN